MCHHQASTPATEKPLDVTVQFDAMHILTYSVSSTNCLQRMNTSSLPSSGVPPAPVAPVVSFATARSREDVNGWDTFPSPTTSDAGEKGKQSIKFQVRFHER